MATHDDVGLSQPAPSTITKRLDAISLDHNSTVVVREVMVLGSPETTNALTAVLGGAPNSTAWAAVVRLVGGNSSAAEGDGGIATHGNKSSNSSVYLPVRVTNGTAFTDAVSYNVHNSTGDFTGSTVTGLPAMLRSGAAAEGSTDHFLIPWGSSDGAAYVSLVTSTGLGISASTTTPGSNTAGLHVRQVPAAMESSVFSVASSNSTVVIPLISSAAGVGAKVFAYFIGASTSGDVSTFIFLSSGSGGDAGAAKNRFQVLLSSGYSAANLAVNPPTFLFRADANEALNARIESASTRITATVSLSWFSEA
jgi:hypothetical protein